MERHQNIQQEQHCCCPFAPLTSWLFHLSFHVSDSSAWVLLMFAFLPSQLRRRIEEAEQAQASAEVTAVSHSVEAVLSQARGLRQQCCG